jgi:hypothetical protein
VAAPKPKTIKGIREHVAETFVQLLTDMIQRYTDLRTDRDVTIFATFAEPYLHAQETTMIVVDVGSLTVTTSTFQPFQGDPYYNATHYETLGGMVNIHCMSKKELYSDRLATIVLWFLSSKRREVSKYGLVDAVVRALSEPITILDEESPNAIAYFDEVVAVEFTYASFYNVVPDPNTPLLTMYNIETTVEG